MADYSPRAQDVAALRRTTGAGMLDARDALSASEGDMEAAARLLREQGKVASSKRSERERAEGAVSVVVLGEGRLGAVLMLECETDFVAKSADFVGLVDSLTEALATDGEAGLQKYEDEIEQLKGTLKENIAIGRHERFEAAPGAFLGSYLHFQNGRGVNGVLVELAGGSAELAHDLAVSIAFSRPEYLSRDDVPAEAIAAEREIIETTARNENRPEAQMEKIVEGRMNGWFKERVLLEQPWARDDKKSVAQLLGGADVTRFAQVVVGA